MDIFSKEEYMATALIFLIVGTISFFNFRSALMRARDTTRRDDLGAISNALGQFYEDFGYFPPSEEGKIKYCRDDDFEEILVEIQDNPTFDRNKFFEGLRVCEWGQDEFDDLLEEDYGPYIKKLPQDPKTDEGLNYHYISNTRRFQLYSHLEEGDKAQGYSPGAAQRGLMCGEQTCNFGRSFAQTPLDISLEEYEVQLEKQRLEKLGQ